MTTNVSRDTQRPLAILINPPTSKGLGYESEHLGLGYLAASLQADGWQISIIDAYLEQLTSAQTLEAISAHDEPGFVGLTIISNSAWRITAPLLGHLRSHWPGVPLLLGGYYATFWHREVAQQAPQQTIIVRGEGEATILELAKRILQRGSFADLKGITFVHKGKVVVNPPRPLVPSLDDLPFPDRRTIAKVIARGGFPSIYGSRGCYYQCSFCEVCSFYRRQPGPMYRGRSAGNILDEVEALLSKTQQPYVGFVDDEFIGAGEAGRRRALAFCQAVEDRGLEFFFGMQCRSDSVNLDLFHRLKESGLRHIYLGVESAVQRSLDLFNKKLTVADNLKAIETLEALDLDYTVGFILCDPYTTLEEIRKNISFIQKISAFPLGLNGLNVLKGTPLERRFDQEGLLELWEGDYEMKSVHPEMTVFRRQLRLYASTYIPIINRLRQLSSHTLIHGENKLQAAPSLDGCYQQIKALHLHFLEHTVAALERADKTALPAILDHLDSAYQHLARALDLHEADSKSIETEKR